MLGLKLNHVSKRGPSCVLVDPYIDWETCIMAHLTSEKFHIDKGQWQPHCTAPTAGRCLPLGLYMEIVKELSTPVREDVSYACEKT